MHDLDRGRVAWTTASDGYRAWFGSDETLYTAPFDGGGITVRSAETGSIQYTLEDASLPSVLVDIGTHLPTARTDLAAAACKEAGRDLTPAEWTQYVGTFDAYEKTCAEDVVATAPPPAPVTGAANQWPQQIVNGFATPNGAGFWLVYASGSVTTNGAARYYGDASGLPLNGPLTGGAVVPNGTGYWLVAQDGGIFTYGTGLFYGSMGATPLNQPVFSMAPTKSGKGYWLVAGDGGIFTFGDAPFYGSTGNLQLNQPINGITTSPTGKGYRMVARDGGIFSFGDVAFYGSLPGLGLNVTDVVGMAPTPTNRGYWIVRSSGQVYAFGDAKSFGNYEPSACDPVSAIFSNPNEQGYRLVTTSGATVAFGTAPAGQRRDRNTETMPDLAEQPRSAATAR